MWGEGRALKPAGVASGPGASQTGNSPRAKRIRSGANDSAVSVPLAWCPLPRCFETRTLAVSHGSGGLVRGGVGRPDEGGLAGRRRATLGATTSCCGRRAQAASRTGAGLARRPRRRSRPPTARKEEEETRRGSIRRPELPEYCAAGIWGLEEGLVGAAVGSYNCTDTASKAKASPDDAAPPRPLQRGKRSSSGRGT